MEQQEKADNLIEQIKKLNSVESMNNAQNDEAKQKILQDCVLLEKNNSSLDKDTINWLRLETLELTSAIEKKNSEDSNKEECDKRINQESMIC
jgi:NTP pyrophosphatase (non-canonical NTP hydrolase)